jgi:hypothetical protein
MSKADHPSFGRVTNTADDLIHHLLQMGSFDLAMTVMSMQQQVEGDRDDV